MTWRLKLDAARELDCPASVVCVGCYLSEVRVADRRAGDTEEGVIGNVVHLGAKIQPGTFGHVQWEGANQRDIQLVVAGTVDVVRRGTRSVTKGVGRCCRCIE